MSTKPDQPTPTAWARFRFSVVGPLLSPPPARGELKAVLRTPAAKVLMSRGRWCRPVALTILDEHSRLCRHLQGCLSESAEDLVHGLSQAIQKHSLPRALLTDNSRGDLFPFHPIRKEIR